MHSRAGKKRKAAALLAMTLIIAAAVSCVNVEAKKKTKNKVRLNKAQITAYVGMAPVKVKVKNLKKARAIAWKSNKPKIASVAPDGTVSFLKKGNAVVTAKVGKRSLKCVVSVVSRKAYKAVKKAQKFYKSKNMSYSQGNRMGKRSADCSSFCGRCYLPMGITMGGTASWCNTAAGMASWATKNDKVVANDAVPISSLKLLPGDLVFYRKGYNGRYKNIYHVEIFVEYGWKNGKLVGYTMSSITGNYPSILKRDYASRQSRIAEISRPAE